jgi:colanic acid biosynthesis protein WcaH
MDETPSTKLPPEQFAAVVRLTPLVSVDLVVRDPTGAVLVGKRTNNPARGTWFVPGGRIAKDERVADAIDRLMIEEIGVGSPNAKITFRGTFEHIYSTNFAGEEGYGTHYVVLAYDVLLPRRPMHLPDEQHSQYRWMTPAELLADREVHANTQAYFRDHPPTAVPQ